MISVILLSNVYSRKKHKHSKNKISCNNKDELIIITNPLIMIETPIYFLNISWGIFKRNIKAISIQLKYKNLTKDKCWWVFLEKLIK